MTNPKFRFVGRIGSYYRWEPLNVEARRIRSMHPTTPVSWFWGDGTQGVDITARAHKQGKEVGLSPHEYAEYVRSKRPQVNPLGVIAEGVDQ